MTRAPARATLFPYTTLFRSFRSVRYQRKETELVIIVTPRLAEGINPSQVPPLPGEKWRHPTEGELLDRKSTRLNSSHLVNSYAVFCLKKKKAPADSHCVSRS